MTCSHPWAFSRNCSFLVSFLPCGEQHTAQLSKCPGHGCQTKIPTMLTGDLPKPGPLLRGCHQHLQGFLYLLCSLHSHEFLRFLLQHMFVLILLSPLGGSDSCVGCDTQCIAHRNGGANEMETPLAVAMTGHVSQASAVSSELRSGMQASQGHKAVSLFS